MLAYPIFIFRSPRSEEVTLSLGWTADVQQMPIWGKVSHRHKWKSSGKIAEASETNNDHKKHNERPVKVSL